MTKQHSRNRPRSAPGRRQHSAADSKDNWLWGHHAVAAALGNPRRIVHRVVASPNAIKKLGGLSPAPEPMHAKDIDRLLPQGAVHQGVAAQCKPLAALALEDVLAAAPGIIAVLDQVSDPHNLGAIFRSAAAFGVGALVLQTRNAPEMTGTVAKSAVGAVETVPECRVVNISRSLEALADAGYHTVGLDGGGRADIRQAIFGAGRLAIVLGAEGPGLRPGVAKSCLELAHIPIDPNMESLNVSNAAAIAFYEAANAKTEL